MKKHLLVVSSIALPILAMAQVSNPPRGVQFQTGMHGLHISPNGEWIGSMAGDASVYNIQEGKLYDYWGSILGLGNCVANNGIAVGDSQDHATILMNGQTIYPTSLNNKGKWFCDLNAITPDATRICGILNNPEGGETMYVPFVCDMDENGEVGDPIYLPYPKVDFFRMKPQYATAVWMSDNGKVVIGDVVDWRGEYSIPIVYTEDENGVWDYYLPSEKMFNPTHIDIPDNPWINEPTPPEPVDYMSNVARMAYEAAYEEWAESNYTLPYPDPATYMTEAEIEAYNAAAEEYNKNWAENPEVIKAIQEYMQVYYEVLKTSPSFSGNEQTIHPDGIYMMQHGSLMIDEDRRRSYIYKFNIPGPDYELYDMPAYNSPYPKLILPDGTVIASTRLMENPTSFIMNPGTKEFVPLVDYLTTDFPQVAEWIDLNFPGGTGAVSMSRDKKVLLGTGIVGMVASYTGDDNYYYWTYIWQSDVEIAGIEDVVNPMEEGVYLVFNLQGVKVLETKDASALSNLPKGIYVINGKKVML